MPFAATTPDGLTEGAIDMLVEGPDDTIVIDFKTDTAGTGARDALEAVYFPQLEKYVDVVRRAIRREVLGRPLFLQTPSVSGAMPLRGRALEVLNDYADKG